MSTENIEKEVAGISGKDALSELTNMSRWMRLFAKDNERRAARLAQIVKQAQKGYFCPPNTEEAAALVKRTADDSERILKWLRLLDKASEKMNAEGAAEEKKGERK